jgi:hypothetical protein
MRGYGPEVRAMSPPRWTLKFQSENLQIGDLMTPRGMRIGMDLYNDVDLVSLVGRQASTVGGVSFGPRVSIAQFHCSSWHLKGKKGREVHNEQALHSDGKKIGNSSIKKDGSPTNSNTLKQSGPPSAADSGKIVKPVANSGPKQSGPPTANSGKSTKEASNSPAKQNGPTTATSTKATNTTPKQSQSSTNTSPPKATPVNTSPARSPPNSPSASKSTPPLTSPVDPSPAVEPQSPAPTDINPVTSVKPQSSPPPPSPTDVNPTPAVEAEFPPPLPTIDAQSPPPPPDINPLSDEQYQAFRGKQATGPFSWKAAALFLVTGTILVFYFRRERDRMERLRTFLIVY